MNDFFAKVARNSTQRNLDLVTVGDYVLIYDSQVNFLARLLDIDDTVIKVKTIPSPREEVAEEVKLITPYHIDKSITVSHVDLTEKQYNATCIYLNQPSTIKAKGQVIEFYYTNEDYAVEEINRTRKNNQIFYCAPT